MCLSHVICNAICTPQSRSQQQNKIQYIGIEIDTRQMQMSKSFISVQIPYFSYLVYCSVKVIKVWKLQHKSTSYYNMHIPTNQETNMIQIVAELRLLSRLRDFSVEAGSLLSRAGSYNANGCSAILSFFKKWPAHQNRKENVNKMWV